MAEETLNTTTTTTVTNDKQVVVAAAVTTDVPEAEEPHCSEATTDETTVSGETTKNMVDDEVKAAELSLAVEKEEDTKAVGGDRDDNEKKALAQLKLLIQTALNNHEFCSPTITVTTAASPAEAAVEAEEAKGETQQAQEVAVEVAVVPTETQEDNQAAETDVPKEQTDQQKKPEEEEVIKKVNIEEDGTKTVEAIEETVVSSPVALTKQEAKTPEEEEASPPRVVPEEVSIWGVPLLQDERTDTVLWKFLQARDFRVKDAFAMIKNTIKWRKEFGIDDLVDQDLDIDGDLAKAAFMQGVSKEGNPVCYNVYGAFQDKELYQKTFSDEEKREKFLKWRVQLLERSVRNLDFVPGGISTIVQVNDLKNSPGPGKWELRQATKQALHLFQDNYPEFVAKQVFINVPWWYMAVNKMISPFLTQRTKSKFVFAGPSKSAETLFSYIAPEQVPVQYGGLSRSEGEFGTKNGVTQIIVKPTSKETVEFAVTEACHLTWEVRVLGWEVNYGAEFVPNAKENYTIIIQKMRKVGATEETIISNSFKTSEPGKVVLTIDNVSSKKKRLLYRLKSNPSSSD